MKVRVYCKINANIILVRCYVLSLLSLCIFFRIQILSISLYTYIHLFIRKPYTNSLYINALKLQRRY